MPDRGPLVYILAHPVDASAVAVFRTHAATALPNVRFFDLASDTCAGELWRDAQDRALQEASIVLAFISPDMLADVKLMRILCAARKFVPVWVRPNGAAFLREFDGVVGLPTNGKAISLLSSTRRAEAWLDVAVKLRKML